MWGIPCGVDLKECTHVDTYIALHQALHCIAFASCTVVVVVVHCGTWVLMSGEDQIYIYVESVDRSMWMIYLSVMWLRCILWRWVYVRLYSIL